QAEDGIRDRNVTGVQTCALPIAIAEKAAQEEINQRRAVVSAAIGFLDQLAGESKAAAIASIALSKGLAIAEAIQNTAVAVTAARSEERRVGEDCGARREAPHYN